MIDVFSVHGVDQVISFLVWTFVVLGMAKVLFQSFLLTEILRQFRIRNAKDSRMVRQLQWELRHKIKWSMELEHGDINAARVPLTPPELDQKHQQLSGLMRVTWKSRALIYFTNCSFCQFFWTALIVWLVINGPRQPLAMVLSTVTYAAVSTLINSWVAQQLLPPSSPLKPPDKNCPGCG